MQVTLILLAGVVAAAQIGKAAIAIPLLRQDFDLDLVAASWFLGAFAVLGAIGGIVAGYVASSFPMRRVIVAGLVFIAIGNCVGTASPDAGTLLASRVFEGLGFLAIVVSAPALLRNIAPEAYLPVIISCWSAYIPVGTALMMLAGPSIMQGGWQVLWLYNAVLAGLLALALVFVLKERNQTSAAASLSVRDILQVLRSRERLLLAFAFFLYSVQYFALATFLPVFLVSRLGLSLQQAGTISALALAANAIGNISAGLFLKIGIPLWQLMVTVFAAIGLLGFGIFSSHSPIAVSAFCAGLCLGIAALLPASILAAMPRLADTSQKLALSVGLIQQASALGQAAGPVILAFWIQRSGWNGVQWMFLIVAILGLFVAIMTRSAFAEGRRAKAEVVP